MKCHEALGKEGGVITLKLGLDDLKQWLKHTADLAATGKWFFFTGICFLLCRLGKLVHGEISHPVVPLRS